MSRVTFILGLQGVGKTTYIRKHHRDAPRVLDYEEWWNAAQEEHPGMDNYELATYVKMAVHTHFVMVLSTGDDIVVECTGMSKVGQAAIRAMLDAARDHGCTAEIVYLKPRDYNTFADAIPEDDGAVSMFSAWGKRRSGDRWREPDECPYFEAVTVVEVDHARTPNLTFERRSDV